MVEKQDLMEKFQRIEIEMEDLRENQGEKRRELQKEIDFLTNELNHKQLEQSELKEKLRKREDELRDLKQNLNE